MKKTVIIFLTILVIIVGVTAYLNRAAVVDKQGLQGKAILVLAKNGEEVERFDLAEIQKMGEETFKKELDTSTTGPVAQTYTGVLLKNVLVRAGIELTGEEEVLVKAIDGYTTVLTAGEVLAADNVYLVYKNNGEYLKGKSEGGTGPYRIVIKSDQFGQRWCKFVVEVEVK